MSTIPSIRRRCADGDGVAEIAREEGASEPTVRKYRDMGDFSPQPAKRGKARPSKLDPYKATIDSWLAEYGKRRAKQRHTATRIFDRLVAECGYDGGYTTVQKCAKERKSRIKCANGQFLNLETASLMLALKAAAADDGLESALGDIAKANLLIIDEYGHIPIDIEGARLLYRVMSATREARGMIVTTNIEFGKWGTVLGDARLAAATVDRIVHHGRLVEFGGQGRRS